MEAVNSLIANQLTRKILGLAISPATRTARINELRSSNFDVLIIGGGITGAGALLEAASRGYKAALIEAGDFASGTSQASSKLIHGGLRYLSNGEIKLVYENLAERSRLLKNAPSLVRPLDFVIPLPKTNKTFDKFGALSYSLALWGYDVTGGMRIGTRHKRLSLSKAKSMFPKLEVSLFSSSYLYRDAWCDDVRLTLAVLEKAQLEFEAKAVNYLEALEPTRSTSTGKIIGYKVRSHFNGDDANNREFEISASTVINATGTTATKILSQSNDQPPVTIRPSKGVHIVFTQESLPAKVAAVLRVPGDARTIFVLPWGSYTYVGTTDTDLNDQELSTTQDDIDYLINAVNAWITNPLTRSEVTGAWVGSRPLINTKHGKSKLSNRTKDLSRRHLVIPTSDSMISILGGKLTTYRKMAQDAIDALDIMSSRKTVSISSNLSLEATAKIDQEPSLLGQRYGSNHSIVRQFIKPHEPEIISGEWRIFPGEIDYQIAHEHALRLSDILLRRLRVGILDQNIARDLASQVLERMSELLSLDEEEQKQELADFEANLERELPIFG